MTVGLLGCGRGPFWEFREAARCTSVDFVYVIDNSESMERHQANLRASFGPFIDGMRRTLDDVDDYHVGVVTTDAYRSNEPHNCRRLGALVTHTGGEGTNYQQCGPFSGGKPYMTNRDDLDESFNCTAAVGVSGSREEKPMEALEEAINPKQHWYDECNADFIRDDALLVAVVITDEWDGAGDPDEDDDDYTSNGDPMFERSKGDPNSWYESVVKAKGSPNNAVVVSLLNGAGTGCGRDHPRYDGQNIAEFTDKFPYGFVGGICEDDYGEIFADAVQEIDQACDNYEFVQP